MKNFYKGSEIITDREMADVLLNYGSPNYTNKDFEKNVELLLACLDNIEKYSIKGDFEMFGDAFEPEEKKVFVKYARLLKQ